MRLFAIALIFTALTPGVLVNLPPVHNDYEHGLIMTGISTPASAFIHGLLFALLSPHLLRCLSLIK